MSSSPRFTNADAAIAFLCALVVIAAVAAAAWLVHLPVHGAAQQLVLVDELPLKPGGMLTVDVVRIDGAAMPPAAVERGVAAHRALSFEGWAIDPEAQAPAAGVVAAFDGRNVLAAYGRRRSDVANAYRAPQYVRSGFLVSIPANRLTPGRHELRWLVVSHAADAVFTPRTQQVLVR